MTRYIDADALMRKIADHRARGLLYRPDRDGTWNIALHLVEAAPTALTVERLAQTVHSLYGSPCEVDGCTGGIIGEEHAAAILRSLEGLP